MDLSPSQKRKLNQKPRHLSAEEAKALKDEKRKQGRPGNPAKKGS